MARKKAAAASTNNAEALSTGSVVAHWTVEETSCLIEYLIIHCAEGGDGTGFKQATFTGASAHLHEPPDGVLKENYVVGTGRDWQSCKNKWINVHSLLHSDYHI